MKLSRYFLIYVLLSATLQLGACTADKPSAQYNQIMQSLKESTTQNNYEQIMGAVNTSPQLKQEINNLASTGKLTGFLITSRSNLNEGKATIYGGFTRGTQIVLTDEFMRILQKNRYFDVVYSDDIAPNNTVFALTHLVHHIQIPIDTQKYNSPTSYTEAKLKDEALAFIEAWNAMLYAAETQNNGKSLTVRQAGQLLINTRYKFAFKGVRHWNKDNSLPIDKDNISQIVSTLYNHRIADIE